MKTQGRIYLFGDQTNDFVPDLRQLLRIQDSPLLTAFLEKTHIALRQEISQQGREIQDFLPRFSRVVDLLAAYSTDIDSAPVLASTLTAIYQLGSFISYYGDGSRTYPTGQSQVLLGMCTGQLAASAVAAASTVVELVPLAVEAVVIAFRTGLQVTKTRQLLENGPDRNKNWSFIVPKMPADVAAARIEQFSQSANLPVGSRPFIGTVAPTSITIFGHPRVLGDFFSSPIMADVKAIPVPVFAPYHEPNLYAESDIDHILESLSEAAGETAMKLPVISSVTGGPISASTLREQLYSSLEEILRQPLLLDTVIKSVGSACQASSLNRWNILPIGTSASRLASALGERSGITVEIEQLGGAPSLSTRSLNAGGNGRPEQSKIAIIGYSGRFPDAASPEGLWEILEQGRDVHREIPADRFNVNTHYDPTGKTKNASGVRHGCFIKDPGFFDCRFFNLSPKEADQSDPAQRLALLTAYEAIEMAGIVPDRTPSTQRDRVGIFYGMTSDDWREVNSGQDVGTYFIPGGNRAFTPGRINYHFKFSGPSVSVDTACSSSACAIHIACNSLWRNDCDTAIAGGTNLMTNPDNFTGLDRGHFLSHTGNCKTFDDGADGYCRADAVGTVVLKRLEDALADKDPIQAVICGAYTNHSAEAESITRPHIGAQSAIFRRILNGAGHDPLDVSYIEMHGTGTQAGDAVEMRSVLDVFAGNRSGRTSAKPLYLGSVKANIGHAESGSGVASLIKVIMMMKNSQIPRHVGIKTKLNTGFPKDLEQRGIRIAMEATPWQKPAGGNRMAFLNNFSAAGGNSALLVEDSPAPIQARTSEDPRTSHLVTVSARTLKSIRANVERLVAHLDSNPGTDLGSLAYTTTARRIHHNYRVSVTGKTLADVKAALQKSTAQDVRPVPRKVPGLAWAFTGQGAVYEGMGKNLFASFRVFREEVQRLDGISRSFGFDSFLPLLLGGATPEQTTQFTPQATQLALSCFEIALARLWESFGVVPNVIVGHSLGEYAALHIAGVLSARDVVFLVGTRARIMQERCTPGTHAMLAVKGSVASLAPVMLSHSLEVACINGPSQTVLAGLGADVDRAQEALAQNGIKATRLKTDFAFHSSQVEPVLTEFEKLASGIVFRKPTIPVLSPLLASVITEEGELSTEYLARHCRETVNIAGAVEAAVSQKLLSEDTICLEMGPDLIVSGMLKACLGSSAKAVASVRKSDTIWATLTDALSTLYQAGREILWDEFHRDFNAFHEMLSLPSYQWDYKNHWIQYVHDWCLTKGNAPQVQVAVAPPAGPLALPAPEHKYLSATCQKVLSSEHGSTQSSVLIESDISHPDLRAVFEAHKVNGAILCPSSVYADIAVTLGNYLSESNPIPTNNGVEVADMATTKPLLMRNPGKTELFRVSAEANWASQEAQVAFYSVDLSGNKTIEHATCTIRFGNPDAWLSEWKRVAHLVRSRMQNVRDAARDGNSHLIKRGMVYKLFENCVEYGEAFQGIDEVCLDSKAHEATARVNLKDNSTCFHANPYYIDSLGHLSGFIMNATESFDYKTQVFLNHGWESIRCAVKLSPTEQYDTYVKMESTNGSHYVGDVYVFQGDRIIGVNQGVAFQSVPRKVLDLLLPNPSKGVATKAAKESAPAAPAARPSAPQKTVASPAPSPKAPAPVKAAKAAAPAPKKESVLEPLLIVQVMDIIAQETGITIAEMKNDLDFADVGVDSLLSLTICSRLREEHNIDVSSTLFIDYPTVRDLKNFLGAGAETPAADSDDSSKSSTPQSGFSSYGGVSDSCSDVTLDEPVDLAVGGSSSSSSSNSPFNEICAIMADEIGVKVEEVWNAPSLSELGLDSLMSLTVLGRMRDELNVDLPMDFFFDDDMAIIRKKLIGDDAAEEPATKASPAVPIPPATSVVLQGSLATAKKVLILFPDGSGSAASYATLPRVARDAAVVALNCPYVKRPQDLKCGLQDLTEPYLAEIRRRQPHGPYYLGGWSAGGICAYDAAARLMAAGEEVAGLILLDSPNPIKLDKLPVRMYHFLDSVNIFGYGAKTPPPEWLLPHFLAFIDSLAAYEPSPFPAGKAPQTHAIWAADGVYRSTGGKRLPEQPDDVPAMKWLLEDRKTFGPNGWDQLVGEKLRIEVLKGANHFTMMQGEQALQLSQFLARSLGL
ncbi:polyketide synthase for naphthopyrone YWA1 [Echria macrotheca]|uniref:Polyketide synthase for naphthopyrone YWA1 n=1 Tax=Echria macrotheca TaxID=438768 RepID=A0AAJ0B677_9PEZI|nr:polyketide synthase for naphthopyrone YWA1 [Echria macrotheca]